MNIISWNVAGLRAILKKDSFNSFINSELNNYDIICLQETKAEESQVQLSEIIKTKYPHRYWNSTKGTTQRRGLSGTTIWCASPPMSVIPEFAYDEEGRVVSLEFNEFVLVNVYVPNSQKLEGERYYFRETWNNKFMTYISELEKTYKKNVIVCGDMNVAHNSIDICNPKQKINKVPGFFNNERDNFNTLLNVCNLIDVFRNLNIEEQWSTYWSNFLKQPRSKVNGWRIDYFLVSKKFFEKNKIIDCKILMDVMGSDHCPLLLKLK
mgnify:CR=1 FL=1